MYPSLLKLGPVTVHTYGLLIALGFLVAFFAAKREFVLRGLPNDFMDNSLILMMLASFFGARVFYFLISNPGYLASDPLSFFRIWEGGLVFYGGFLGAVIFLAFYCRRREVAFLDASDALAGPLLIGQAFGRLGCFFAGCCYGRPTDSICGVTFTHPDSLAPRFISLHPTQLYSTAGDALLLIGLWIFRKPLSGRGLSTSYYFIGYGIGRFFIEYLRADDRGAVIGGLQPSQWISIVLVAAGLILGGYVQRKNTN